jgi:PHD/YefM family antitoxin component YafN of YafNO toxin-antitoxin module
MARSEPITIEKKGRPVTVVLAIEEYQRMESELERFADLRLQQSISDMEAGKTSPAKEVFTSLKERYS